MNPLAMVTAAGSNRATSLKPHNGACGQIEPGRCGRVQLRHGRTIHGPSGRASRAESNKGDAMMKDDLNVIGIKICNGVSRKMGVEHDIVIQPTNMALVSVPEEWHWSQWTKMTVGV